MDLRPAVGKGALIRPDSQRIGVRPHLELHDAASTDQVRIL